MKTLLVALVVALAACGTARAQVDPSIAAEIKTAAAAAAENAASIKDGYAKYKIVRRRPEGELGTPMKEWSTETVDVYFTTDSIYWKSSNSWEYILRPDAFLSFHSGALGTPNELAPPHYIAHIYPPKEYQCRCEHVHPALLGNLIDCSSRRGRTGLTQFRDMLENFPVELRREAAEGLIHFDWSSDSGAHDLWLDPKSAYGIAKLQKWSLKYPDDPYFESKSEFQTLHGSVVAKRHTEHHRVVEDGVMYDQESLTVELLEYQPKPVPPTQFELEVLKLPKGARVLDHRSGELSLYGMEELAGKDLDDRITEMLLEAGKGER